VGWFSIQIAIYSRTYRSIPTHRNTVDIPEVKFEGGTPKKELLNNSIIAQNRLQ
jgi:hypothetical protein